MTRVTGTSAFTHLNTSKVEENDKVNSSPHSQFEVETDVFESPRHSPTKVSSVSTNAPSAPEWTKEEAEEARQSVDLLLSVIRAAKGEAAAEYRGPLDLIQTNITAARKLLDVNDPQQQYIGVIFERALTFLEKPFESYETEDLFLLLESLIHMDELTPPLEEAGNTTDYLTRISKALTELFAKADKFEQMTKSA